MSDDVIIEFTDTLVVVTCWCGINHAVPRDLRNFQLRQHRDGQRVTSIFCPLGHSHAPAGKSEAEKLREQKDRLEARHRALADQLEAETRSHRATKGQLTKVKKRIGKGVCPGCNRHFADVERHMATQHPDLAGGAS